LTSRNVWCYTSGRDRKGSRLHQERASNGKQAFRFDGALERFIGEAALARIKAGTITSSREQAIEPAPFAKAMSYHKGV
jgi:hypothetical protein